MALTAGTRLGPYEVTALIGAGGMGEVYGARDTRLQRDVAIKVLPEVFAGDPDRLARFQREAQVLASLNHPNIAAIHGLEEADGITVPSSSSLWRATRWRTASRVARSHSTRRCLSPRRLPRRSKPPTSWHHSSRSEPANVKITATGHVKVLDFGLAKLVDGPPKGGHYVWFEELKRLVPTN